MHDPLHWHSYDGDHHHGVNPNAYLDLFGSPLYDFLAQYGEIGMPWATSPQEEHEGYIWLYTEMRPGTVDQFNNGGKVPWDKLHYIKHALVKVHTTGDMHHLRKRFHSHYGFFVVEDRNTGAQGVVATGGWADYGIMHAPYKTKHCPLPSDPPGFTNLNQPPYRSTQTAYRKPGELVHFWSGLRPNVSVAKFFPDDPQYLFGLAWNTLDATEYPGVICADEMYDKPAVLEGSRQFQLFTLALHNLPAARPFTGWTDRHGHLVSPTGTPGVDEVPLIISAEVPQGNAMLNRPVKHGDALAAPLMEF